VTTASPAPGDAPPVALAAHGLTKRFGDLTAVDGIDFEIRRGECFGFLGPNGAGKTTTMRMLSCMARRDAGTLTVLGDDPGSAPRRVKARLGVVAQDINLDIELTVRENLQVYARYFDLDRAVTAERIEDLLDFVQLRDRADWPVDRLSGGMQRRVQIARALINDPQVVLLDEPTTGLDPQARHLVWDRLRNLRTRGVTLVLTTHYMDEAEQLCDRLVVMDHGVIARAGRPRDLIDTEVGREVVELIVADGDADRLITALAHATRGHHRRGDVVSFFAADGEAVYLAARDTAIPIALRAIRRATLEDVFLRVTGHALREG